MRQQYILYIMYLCGATEQSTIWYVKQREVRISRGLTRCGYWKVQWTVDAVDRVHYIVILLLHNWDRSLRRFFYGGETGSWQEGTRRFGPMLHMWCSHRPHTLACPCAGRKLLVPSCFWKGQYSTLFLPSQEVERGALVTSCVLLVLKLAVAATVGPNRDLTKLSKTVGSGVYLRWQLDSFEHKHTLCSFHLHWTFKKYSASPGRGWHGSSI